MIKYLINKYKDFKLSIQRNKDADIILNYCKEDVLSGICNHREFRYKSSFILMYRYGDISLKSLNDFYRWI